VPDGSVQVAIDSPPIDVTLGDRSIVSVCDDIISPTYTAPTLTSWTALATDEGLNGITVVFGAVTAGSPCRVRFKLTEATATVDQRSGYTAPEQNTPHAVTIDATGANIIASADRGLTYDLYWSWSSGMSTGAYALVAAAAIYNPIKGEGDFPASG